jgi:hypothetical protein
MQYTELSGMPLLVFFIAAITEQLFAAPGGFHDASFRDVDLF